jgi:methionyl-tRNA synthetase
MKYYLTTPIYYVNDKPHIGHAYTTVAADVLARWKRLSGDDVFFLTGTDEHGAKICQAAEKAGSSPKEFCDFISAEFSGEWKNLKITNDYFVRTTDEKHEKAVQKFLDALHASDAIEKGRYEGLYCVGCEKFISESDLVDGCCPDHKQKPVKQSEENWFFRLSDYQKTLLDIISDDKDPRVKIFPIERRNEIIGKLKALTLENISISRSNLEWGVPLPFDPGQTAYVWVDALLNYITAIGYGEDSEQFKKLWPADLHLMAKDILWFHSVIWPAMLLALKLPLPQRIFAHGFFTINGDKMSKTLGNVILPKEMTAKFGVDASRYLLLSLFPFGSDGDISWKALTDKYNTDLANNLGNLVSRTLTMVDKYFEGKVPPKPKSSRFTEEIINIADFNGCFEDLEFTYIFETIQKYLNNANQYIESSAPWKMAKNNDPELSTVLYELIAMIKIAAMAVYPFMPEISATIWSQIGSEEDIEKEAGMFFQGGITSSPKPGNAINKSAGLFPRIQDK